MIIRDKAFYKMVASIAIPIALQGIISITNNMLDTIMVGSLGETSLSATALSGQIFFILMILNFGLGGGAAVLSAQYWGKGDSASIRKLLSMIHKIGLGISLLFMLGALLVPGLILRIYTNEIAVIEEGIPYLRLVALMYPFFSLMTPTSIVLRTVGQVKVPAYANFISFLINASLNYIFIFGKLGAPALGVTGAAVGTLAARFVEFLIVFGYLIKKDKRIQFEVKFYLGWYKDIFKKYIASGTNVLISDAFLAVGLSALSMIMGRMGSEMVAANSIASIIAQLSTIFVGGMASAASILTGNTVGRGEMHKAYEQGITLTLMSLGIGIFAAGVIQILKPVAINFYNVSDYTKSIAMQLMNSMSFLIIFQAMGTVLTKGVLRGGGDTKFLLMADVLFLWIVSVPLGAFSGLVLGLEPWIVYLCLRIDEIIKTVWCLFRLLSNKWIKDCT